MYTQRKRKIRIILASIILAVLSIVVFLVLTKRVTNPAGGEPGATRQFFVDLGSLSPFKRDGSGNEGGEGATPGGSQGGGIDREGLVPPGQGGSGELGGGSLNPNIPQTGFPLGGAGDLPQTPLPPNTTPPTGGGVNPCITNPRDVRCAQNAIAVRSDDVSVVTPPTQTVAAKELILTPDQQRRLNDLYFAFYRFSPGLADEELIKSYEQDIRSYEQVTELVTKEGGLIDQCVAIITDDQVLNEGTLYNLVGRRFYGELYPYSSRSQFALGSLDGLPSWKFERMYDTERNPYYMTYTHSSVLNQPRGWLKQEFILRNFINLSVINESVNESEGEYFADTSFILPASKWFFILSGGSVIQDISSIQSIDATKMAEFSDRKKMIENLFGIY